MMNEEDVSFDDISHRQLCFAVSSIILISRGGIFPFDEIFCEHFY